MAWQSLVLEADGGIAEALSDALMDAGAVSVSVEDADAGTDTEQPKYGEPGMPAADPAWPSSRLSALFVAEADATAALVRAARACGIAEPPRCRIELVPDDDWVGRVRTQFEPIQVTGRMWIVPTWHTAPDPQAINIVLDPGLAFGTGSHPTTQLCLRWIERNVTPDTSLIDYGCGSGILAIAAARLGARPVTGIDIDPNAVVAARSNAAANAVEATFLGGDAPMPPAADLMVANILANPLHVLAPVLARLTRPGGRIVLAGLLVEQADELIASYDPWFEMGRFASSDGWTALEGVRRPVR